MEIIICPICDEPCVVEEALKGLGYGSDEVCEVAVCKNKKCINFDKTLFDVDEYLENDYDTE
jgi:hypothetical protein